MKRLFNEKKQVSSSDGEDYGVEVSAYHGIADIDNSSVGLILMIKQLHDKKFRDDYPWKTISREWTVLDLEPDSVIIREAIKLLDEKIDEISRT